MLSVPVVARRRSLGVLAVQEHGGGWAYVWGAAGRMPVGSVLAVARQIAEVGR
ncbi:hypothetical protein [Actinomadura physcomitrii]|uniref:hypothetical protein n=1 Tax=Actinomadura physcomitrii TaxID=2650748 RepID=UPI0013684149|nr:hypothetical protein [Actinomadura physcomitrii]